MRERHDDPRESFERCVDEDDYGTTEDYECLGCKQIVGRGEPYWEQEGSDNVVCEKCVAVVVHDWYYAQGGSTTLG